MDIPLTVAISVGSAIIGGLSSFFMFRLNIEKKIQKIEDTKLGITAMDNIRDQLTDIKRGIDLLKAKNDEITKDISELKTMIKDQDRQIRENENELNRICNEHDMMKSSHFKTGV